MIDIVEALDDPNLFGPWFAGPSWSTWKAVLKAAFCLPMDADELALFRVVAQRDPPRRRVRELWAVVGRRGGKDSIASAIACYAAGFVDYGRLLRPGEAASVLCLAVDKAQAAIVAEVHAELFQRDRAPSRAGEAGDVGRARAFDRRRAERPGLQLSRRARSQRRLRRSWTRSPFGAARRPTILTRRLMRRWSRAWRPSLARC